MATARDILLVDAGHTRTKLALCRDVSPGSLPEVLHAIAAMNEAEVDWAAVRKWCTDWRSVPAILTGTNARMVDQVASGWPRDLPAPFLLREKLLLPLDIRVQLPEKVGMDRLLTALAAGVLKPADQAAICVDSGTAITANVIAADGAFLGGAILPGIILGAKSLHEQTTTLPHINIWELLKREPAVLGLNTEAAIASGLYWGHLGAVKELIARYSEAFGSAQSPPPLFLTGGAAGILSPYLPQAKYFPQLALQGLAVAARTLLK